jgi:hypothetical protein
MSRQGLKRLGCERECGCIAYMTLSQLETHGLPVCPCGGRMVPESLEVAAAVLDRETLETLPAWREYAQGVGSVMRGQGPHMARAASSGRELANADTVALQRFETARKREAHTRRLSGLRQYVVAAQVAAEIPF